LEGVAVFKNRLSKYLKQIFEDPHRADNPVLDRLESIIEDKRTRLENENAKLKKQITELPKKGGLKTIYGEEESIDKRIERVFKVLGAEKEYSGEFYRETPQGNKQIKLPISQGNFNLFITKEGDSLLNLMYVSVVESGINIKTELSDVRVLMQLASKGQGVECNFIIVTNDDLSSKVAAIQKDFAHMKTFLNLDDRDLFELEVWDKNTLLVQEEQLGIKVNMQ
jgi:hypothetical protein